MGKLLLNKDGKNTLLVIDTLYREKGIQLMLDVDRELQPIYKLPLLNII